MCRCDYAVLYERHLLKLFEFRTSPPQRATFLVKDKPAPESDLHHGRSFWHFDLHLPPPFVGTPENVSIFAPRDTMSHWSAISSATLAIPIPAVRVWAMVSK